MGLLESRRNCLDNAYIYVDILRFCGYMRRNGLPEAIEATGFMPATASPLARPAARREAVTCVLPTPVSVPAMK